MRPGQRLSDGLLRLDDDGIDGAVNGTGIGDHRRSRASSAGCRTASSAAYALTMVARGRGGRRCDRPRTARLREELSMTFPWLSVLALLPLVGAAA